MGPLPAAVYWRRRLVAVAATTAVIILLAWALGSVIAPSRGDAETTLQPAAQTAPGATGPASGPESAPPVQPIDPAGDGDGAGGGAGVPAGPPSDPTADPPAGTATVDPTTSTGSVPSSTSERVLPDDTPRAPVPVPPAEPLPPTGPVACTNEMLRVGAEVADPETRIGQRPTFRLVVVNVSAQPCVRDLDGERQEIVVWSADLVHRLWSSNDCVNPDTDDLRTLVPGRPVAFSVRWAGRTTTPGCRAERHAVPPGDYQIMTRIDDLISAPTPFRRLP